MNVRLLCVVYFSCLSLICYSQEAGIGYIETKPDVFLYDIPSNTTVLSCVSKRDVFDIQDLIIVRKLKKPTLLKVMGFTNLQSKSPLYDAYVVEFSGKNYFVQSSDIVDNSLLEKRNKDIFVEYEILKDSVDRFSMAGYAYRQMDSLIDSKIEYYQNRYALYETHVDSLVEQRTKESIFQDIQDDISLCQSRREKYAKWISTVPSSVQKDANILAIISNEISVGYHGLCTYRMMFINLSNKTIKYLTWNGKVKNAVDDYISCEIHRTSVFSGKYTGPCKPFQIESAEWEPVLFNPSAQTMVLTSIKIDYTDGTSRVIGKPSLDVISTIPNEALDDIDIFNKSYMMHSPYEDEANKQKKMTDDIPLYEAQAKKDILSERYKIYGALRGCKEAKEIVEANKYDPLALKSHLSRKTLSFLFDDSIFSEAVATYLRETKTEPLFIKLMNYRRENFIE